MNVQGAGGLPDYICRIAKAIKKTGKTTSQAISIAVSRVKVWASGKGVDKDTQTKAAAAVAEWEALRAKSHAKSAGKKVVKASRTGEVLCLANTSYNVDAVRDAWYGQSASWEKQNASSYNADDYAMARPYVKELWSDYLIVQADDSGLYRVDYEVADDGDVTFDDPTPVKVQYVTLSADSMVGHDLSDADLLRIVAFTPRCQFSALDLVLRTAG